MRIEKGKHYECIKDVFMSISKKHEFVKGKVYKSESDHCLTNESGEDNHHWPGDCSEFFKPHPAYIWVNPDPINPAHYKSYSVETIDMMVAIYGKEKVAIHCELTAFKYRQRLGKKDSLEQDLAKEQWYLDNEGIAKRYRRNKEGVKDGHRIASRYRCREVGNHRLECNKSKKYSTQFRSTPQR